jgi:hypothetical protein
LRLQVAFPASLGELPKASSTVSQFSIMCAWLDQHAGKAGCFTGAQAGAGLQDAALFYFIDAKIAVAFVERFACGLIIGREAPASAAPQHRG